MITTWSLPRLVRARASAGPLLRVLAMVVLLFGVLSAHGLSAESAAGHLVTGAVAPVAPLDEQAAPRLVAIGEPGDGHGPSHTGEHCVSGQPQQGPVLTPPCFAQSVAESTDPGRVSGRPGRNEPALSAASSSALRLSVVQQV
ncbi:hypothetical protein QF034_007527 [Streptomyces africanus]|uniref:Secreted protein n=1 Tax=Streptomyces africanus TaxID=231024 RepID=A0ABU0R112_9ACTN|nr:hypothetical protein [Streptomyces africanus]MDQ0753296.1 hypothetical protein [Streptomyces africanus]